VHKSNQRRICRIEGKAPPPPQTRIVDDAPKGGSMRAVTPAISTDLSEITMAAGSWTNRRTEHAAFELFTRGLPHRRNYLLTAGLEDTVDDLESFHFTHEQIDYIAVVRGRPLSSIRHSATQAAVCLPPLLITHSLADTPYPVQSLATACREPVMRKKYDREDPSHRRRDAWSPGQ
jgi:hypothetical protein